MRILVTNDDGIDAPGLAALVGMLVTTGHEVVVAAPSREHSGSGTALAGGHDGTPVTVADHVLPGTPSVRAVSIDAPPGLAVLSACLGAFGAAPDAVISGINAGPNTGRSLLFSGTVGGALTGALLGRSAMAVSCGFLPGARFDTAAAIALAAVPLLARPEMRGTVLNLNVPDVDLDQIKGVENGPLGRRGKIGYSIERTGSQLSIQPYLTDPADLERDSDAGLLHAGYVTATLLRGALGELDCAPVTELLRRVLSDPDEAPRPAANVT
jgi:5'/3'-nucleotidase